MSLKNSFFEDFAQIHRDTFCLPGSPRGITMSNIFCDILEVCVVDCMFPGVQHEGQLSCEV